MLVQIKAILKRLLAKSLVQQNPIFRPLCEYTVLNPGP